MNDFMNQWNQFVNGGGAGRFFKKTSPWLIAAAVAVLLATFLGPLGIVLIFLSFGGIIYLLADAWRNR